MHAASLAAALATSVAAMGMVPSPSRYPPAPHAQASELPCITFWAETRYAGLGFNHIVHLASECRFKASCSVATNVNPEPQTVSLPASARLDVITFMGSPASVFTAIVQCVRAPISS
jgi:hypothetical protein